MLAAQVTLLMLGNFESGPTPLDPHLRGHQYGVGVSPKVSGITSVKGHSAQI